MALLVFFNFNKAENGWLDFTMAAPEPSLDLNSYDWYRWRKTHWGTKCNAYEISRAKITSKELYYEFDTAWCPPLPWLQYATDMIPMIKANITYIDEAYNFFGKATVTNGEVTYTEDHTELKDFLMCNGIILNPKMTKAEFQMIAKNSNLKEYNIDARLLEHLATFN